MHGPRRFSLWIRDDHRDTARAADAEVHRNPLERSCSSDGDTGVDCHQCCLRGINGSGDGIPRMSDHLPPQGHETLTLKSVGRYEFLMGCDGPKGGTIATSAYAEV